MPETPVGSSSGNKEDQRAKTSGALVLLRPGTAWLAGRTAEFSHDNKILRQVQAGSSRLFDQREHFAGWRWRSMVVVTHVRT
jgi:hypothetical protein